MWVLATSNWDWYKGEETGSRRGLPVGGMRLAREGTRRIR